MATSYYCTLLYLFHFGPFLVFVLILRLDASARACKILEANGCGLSFHMVSLMHDNLQELQWCTAVQVKMQHEVLYSEIFWSYSTAICTVIPTTVL